MEYKIGQRFKTLEDDELYVINNQKAPRYLYARVPDGPAQGIAHEDVMTPYYKPGDQVRVKSKQELNTNGAFGGWTGIYATTVQVLTGVNNDLGVYYANQLILMPEWVEWHSGVEDKPDVQLYPNPETSNYGEWLLPEVMIKGIAKVWQDELAPVDFLPAEVHQDKERNRAALAEVLKIQEPTTNKWMCPKCRFTGSIHDIRQHCVVAHGESLPPPESKSYWETWRVS